MYHIAKVLIQPIYQYMIQNPTYIYIHINVEIKCHIKDDVIHPCVIVLMFIEWQ